MNPSANEHREPLRQIWWLHPAWLFFAVIGTTTLIAATQSDAAYRLYGTPKYFGGQHLLLALAACLVFAVGRELAAATGLTPPAPTEQSDRVARFWFRWTTALTLFGYAVWLAVGIKNGFNLSILRELLTSDDPVFAYVVSRDMFATIKGVTTCAQFGVAALPLGLWLYFRGERRVAWIIGLLLALAAARALLYSERLALVELLVSGLVIALRTCALGQWLTRPVRFGLALAPVAGVAGLLLLFGSYEYFRSWNLHRDEFASIADFTVWRITGYYTSAHNNGAMSIEMQPTNPLPYATIRTLWSFPGVKGSRFGYTKLTRDDPEQRYEEMLEKYGTPELNNEGGLFQPILDFGLGGYLLFWFGGGFIAGRLYRHYLVGTLAGLTLYPLVIVAILETPRLLYLSSTRSLPALVVFVIVLWSTRRVVADEPTRPPMTLTT